MQTTFALFAAEVDVTSRGDQFLDGADVAVPGGDVERNESLHIGDVRVSAFLQKFEEDAQVS